MTMSNTFQKMQNNMKVLLLSLTDPSKVTVAKLVGAIMGLVITLYIALVITYITGVNDDLYETVSFGGVLPFSKPSGDGDEEVEEEGFFGGRKKQNQMRGGAKKSSSGGGFFGAKRKKTKRKFMGSR